MYNIILFTNILHHADLSYEFILVLKHTDVFKRTSIYMSGDSGRQVPLAAQPEFQMGFSSF